MSDPPALSSNNTVAVNTLSPDLRAALVAQALKDLSPNPSGNNTLHYKSWRDTNPTRGRLTNTNLILVVNTNATFVANTNVYLVANTNYYQALELLRILKI